MTKLQTFAGALSLVCAVVACGRSAPVAPSGRVAAKKEANARAAVKAFMLTSVGERSLGPFLTRRADGASLVAWITPPEEHGVRRIVTLPLGAGGEPSGPERTAAMVGLDSATLIVRPMGGGAPGFLVAWTVPADSGRALWVVGLDDDGTARRKPVEITRSASDISWIEVLPTSTGALCLWAEAASSGLADIGAAALDTDGKVRGAPGHAARGVLGWNAFALAPTIGLATVRPAPASADGPALSSASGGVARGLGTLELSRLDDLGRNLGAPVRVIERPTVSPNVEIVSRGDRLLFAWTDRRGSEAFVAGILTDRDGKVSKAVELVRSPAGAELLSLSSSTSGFAALWTLPVRPSRAGQNVYLASFGEDLASLGPSLPIETAGGPLPELAAMESGYAVLASLREDGRGMALPELLRTDASGTLLQRESLSVGADPASFAWNLTCGPQRCVVLTGAGPSPVRIRSTAIEPRRNARRSPGRPSAIAPGDAREPAERVQPLSSSGGPSIADVTSFARGEHVLGLAVTQLGKRSLVASVATSLAGASSAEGTKASPSITKPELPTYTLATRMVEEDGTSQSAAVISTRALAGGGVALAPAGGPDDGAALAWTAVERGVSQVHVTRLDRRGRRRSDVQVTMGRGEVSDVTITWVKDGWIVGWIDDRDGNPEVYATKLDRDLKRTSREERITRAPGPAMDLTALADAEGVRFAWADARDGGRDGRADIYTRVVATHDAKPRGEELRVMATVAHSRTPQLASTGDGVKIAWIEEAPAGASTPSASGYGAMVARLDAKGALAGDPVRLALGGEGVATSVTLGDLGSGMVAVVARATARSMALDLVDPRSEGRPYPLVLLDGPPSLDVDLVAEGGLLYFNDDGPEAQDRRVRRATIAWPP